MLRPLARNRRAAFAVLLALSVIAPGLAHQAAAETRHYHADLNGGTERPPTDSAGNGSADLSVDTDKHSLEYTISFTGLSGPATGAHIHGPAQPGKNAAVMVDFGASLQSPVHGTATLTDAQIQAIDDGAAYLNVHTAAHPGGEIRGALLPAP